MYATSSVPTPVSHRPPSLLCQFRPTHCCIPDVIFAYAFHLAVKTHGTDSLLTLPSAWGKAEVPPQAMPSPGLRATWSAYVRGNYFLCTLNCIHFDRHRVPLFGSQQVARFTLISALPRPVSLSRPCRSTIEDHQCPRTTARFTLRWRS